MKLRHYFFSFLVVFCAFFQTPTLLAGGWGATGKTCDFELCRWSEVYFDMNGLSFNAAMPNYSGTVFQNGIVNLQGQALETSGYLISTTYGRGFKAPKSEKEFLALVEEANEEFSVTAQDAEKFGALYVVDLFPKDSENPIFWRYLITKDRLTKMGTNDPNEARRSKFFNSIKIK